MVRQFFKEHKYIATWLTLGFTAIAVWIAYVNLRQDDAVSSQPSAELADARSSSEPAVEAIWSLTPLSFPASVKDILRYSGINRKIREAVELPEELAKLTGAQRTKVYETIETYVNVHLGDVIGEYGLAKYKGIVSIDVRNLTKTTLEDVILQHPFFFSIAEVYRAGSETEEIEGYADQLEFGEMRPEEKIRATLWLADRPMIFGENIKVLHRHGIGRAYRTKTVVEKE